MPNLNTVQLLGKITRISEIRELTQGNRVLELGMGISENFKTSSGDWSRKVHFVDVILWNEHADTAVKHLKKGEGVLVQGSLQYEQWEDKKGGKRSKLKVKAARVQSVLLPEKKAG